MGDAFKQDRSYIRNGIKRWKDKFWQMTIKDYLDVCQLANVNKLAVYQILDGREGIANVIQLIEKIQAKATYLEDLSGMAKDDIPDIKRRLLPYLVPDTAPDTGPLGPTHHLIEIWKHTLGNGWKMQPVQTKATGKPLKFHHSPFYPR